MKRTFIYLVALTLFTFVNVNGNAQEISDFDFFSSTYERWGQHSFTLHSTGAGGGAYCPNPTATGFGIIYKEGGITPSNVDKDLLLNVLRPDQWSIYYNTDTYLTPEFQVYNYDSSTYENLGYINKEEEYKEFIFCWIVYGRLWYCYVTTEEATQRIWYDEENDEDQYLLDFVYDAYTNPYGMLYFDL